ncbi:MAG: hypothetical protein ACRD2C_23925 [Acidimicrobiales bacterium]
MLQSESLDHKPALVSFDTADPADLEAAWGQLAPLGIEAVTHLVEAYRSARTWQGRSAAVLYATRFARESEEAFQLGVEALGDRARHVRTRACGLLAYSLREEAEGRLLLLCSHVDVATREDARAAVAALREHDHHRFKDRDGTGRVFWIVNQSDLPDS